MKALKAINDIANPQAPINDATKQTFNHCCRQKGHAGQNGYNVSGFKIATNVNSAVADITWNGIVSESLSYTDNFPVGPTTNALKLKIFSLH